MSDRPVSADACCAAWDGELIPLLLGESYHPGGEGLSRSLAERLEIQAGMRVMDLACGSGATARLIARGWEAGVLGIDSSPRALRQARRLANDAMLVRADAHALPVPAGSFDRVICECALSVFPDKPRVLAEVHRVLRPGGSVGISDVIVDPPRLHPDLRSVVSWFACIAGATSVTGYERLLHGAGFEVTSVEHVPGALARMIDEIDARIAVLASMDLPMLADLDPVRTREMLALGRQAVAEGTAGYAVIVASRAVDSQRAHTEKESPAAVLR
ncbi:MAG: methyltransferase domain-containing protein [Actinomycetota bacterium]